MQFKYENIIILARMCACIPAISSPVGPLFSYAQWRSQANFQGGHIFKNRKRQCIFFNSKLNLKLQFFFRSFKVAVKIFFTFHNSGIKQIQQFFRFCAFIEAIPLPYRFPLSKLAHNIFRLGNGTVTVKVQKGRNYCTQITDTILGYDHNKFDKFIIKKNRLK